MNPHPQNPAARTVGLLGPVRRVTAALLATALLSASATAQETRPAFLEKIAKNLAAAEAALQSDPDSLKALSAAGDAALFLGDFKKSVTHFERMIKVDPSQDAPHWRLGIAYYFNEQYAESAKQFAKYHAYDARDRENGVWKFFGDAKTGGLPKARAEMLPYTEFDREPFPALYDLYAGKLTLEQFHAGLTERKLTGEPRVMFFAHYYAGLFEEMLGNHEAALGKLDQAVALFSPEVAGASGPGYMWQVARVHRAWLEKHRGTAR